MSADNGVYVLPVRNKHRTLCYFVYERAAIENLRYEPDREDGYNSAEIIHFMAMGQRHLKIQDALRYASKLKDEFDICEYGVVVLDPVVVR